MTRAVYLVALVACGGEALPAPQYVAPSAPAGWCRVGAGAYAFQWTPSTYPALVKTCPAPATNVNDSTLAEYVVEPGAAIELDVTLPDALVAAGCLVDSLVLAHGDHAGDLAIEFVGESALPIVGYEVVPSAHRVPLADRPPPGQRPGHYQTLSAELARVGNAVRGAAVELAASQDPALAPAVPPPPPRMTAVRHRIAQRAAPKLTFVLRARATAFSIAVRTTAESQDPPLRFRATAREPAIATTFVPQAAVVLSHCRVPATRALATIQTR